MISELLVSKEEQDRLQRMDRLRREGETFIKVINQGPPGFNRIHAVDDIEMTPYVDPDDGMTKFQKQRVSKCVSFEIGKTSGERVTWILDTEYNRFFLSRHLTMEERPCLVIEDGKIAREIDDLVHRPFKVELSKKEKLQSQAREIERELNRIRNEEAKEKKKEGSMQAAAGLIREKKERVKEVSTVELADETAGV